MNETPSIALRKLAARKAPTIGVLPVLVVAFDPDAHSSAFAVARFVADVDVYKLERLEGGGSRRVLWQTITGQRALLIETCAQLGAIAGQDVTVVVETQTPDGPQSADCEPLRRFRYHLEAACEIDGYDYVEVGASAWQTYFLRGEPCGRGQGARKTAYQRKAKSMTTFATNEDRCAALGMLTWYIEDVLGKKLEIKT